jgi:hypothetical protein
LCSVSDHRYRRFWKASKTEATMPLKPGGIKRRHRKELDMNRFKPLSIILILAVAMVLLLGTACGTTSGGESTVGPQGPQGEQGVQGPPGPNMIVAMGTVSADGSLSQDYNVDTVTWDSANSRYVIKLTGITYTHTGYVTIVTAVDSAYTSTYGADSGNLIVYLRNTVPPNAGVKQKYHFSFVVLKAS